MVWGPPLCKMDINPMEIVYGNLHGLVGQVDFSNGWIIVSKNLPSMDPVWDTEIASNLHLKLGRPSSSLVISSDFVLGESMVQVLLFFG